MLSQTADISFSSLIDTERVMNSVGEDLTVLQQLIRLFCAGVPESLTRIEESLERGDQRTAAREVHRLKGQIGYFTLGRPWKLLRQLEGEMQAGEDAGARHLVRQLRRLVEELTLALKEWMKLLDSGGTYRETAHC